MYFIGNDLFIFFYHVAHTILNAVCKSTCLVLTSGDDDHLSGVHDGANTDSEGCSGDFADVVVKETRVCNDSVHNKRLHAGARSKGRPRLVEGDVAVRTDPTKEKLDAAIGFNLLLVALAFSNKVGSITIKDVDVLGRDVDVVKEVGVHEVPVALLVCAGKAHILVHVEGDNVLEGEDTVFHKLDEVLVGLHRRGPGGKTKDKRLLGCRLEVKDPTADVFGSPLAGLCGSVSDDYSHSFLIFLIGCCYVML